MEAIQKEKLKETEIGKYGKQMFGGNGAMEEKRISLTKLLAKKVS